MFFVSITDLRCKKTNNSANTALFPMFLNTIIPSFNSFFWQNAIFTTVFPQSSIVFVSLESCIQVSHSLFSIVSLRLRRNAWSKGVKEIKLAMKQTHFSSLHIEISQIGVVVLSFCQSLVWSSFQKVRQAEPLKTPLYKGVSREC